MQGLSHSDSSFTNYACPDPAHPSHSNSAWPSHTHSISAQPIPPRSDLAQPNLARPGPLFPNPCSYAHSRLAHPDSPHSQVDPSQCVLLHPLFSGCRSKLHPNVGHLCLLWLLKHEILLVADPLIP